MTANDPGTSPAQLLLAVLADHTQAGAYFVDARDRAAMTEAAETLDYVVIPIDFSGCTDKAQSLERMAAGLQFPDWVGDNWDALADALGDLSWLPGNGYLLLLDGIGTWRDHADDDFGTLLDILNEAAATWSEQGTAFWVLLPLPAEQLDALGDEE